MGKAILFAAYKVAECLGLGLSCIRLMNRLGLRKDVVVCMRKESTYVWGSDLGPRTEGKCVRCGETICFERQNGVFQKVCHVCSPPYMAVHLKQTSKPEVSP